MKRVVLNRWTAVSLETPRLRRHLLARDGTATTALGANTTPECTLKTDGDDFGLPAEQVAVAHHEKTKRYYLRRVRVFAHKGSLAELGSKPWHARCMESAFVHRAGNNIFIAI